MKPKAIPAIGAALSAVLLLGFAITVNADTFLVPDDFPTIQEAVDAANPDGGDIVMVGPGEYAGALITNPVRIVGSGGDTRITSGTFLFPHTDAFILYGPFFNVDGTEISNLVIEFEGLGWGVYGESVDNVTISHVTVMNAWRAIDNWYGNGWTITHNIVDGLGSPVPSTPLHFIGIGLIGTSSNNVVAHNYVHHEGTTAGTADDVFSGIGLGVGGGPMVNNNIHHNQVHISVFGPEVCYNFILIDFAGLPTRLLDNKVHHNLSWGECAGVSFVPEDVKEYTKLHHNHWEN